MTRATTEERNDICEYCHVQMTPSGSSLTDANAWVCPQCGHEEVETGSWKLAGQPSIKSCRCKNCLLVFKLRHADIKTLSGKIFITVEGTTFEANIDFEELFCVDLITAVRNRKDPTQALLFLADVGTKTVSDQNSFKISYLNYVGLREKKE